METRAQEPVSLPHPNPTISYWQDPPDAEVADCGADSALPEDIVDTVIVGSGITGAGLAWGLLGGDDESTPLTGDGLDEGMGHGAKRLENMGKKESVVMLEARQACSGATGRNGTSQQLPSPVSPASGSESYMVTKRKLLQQRQPKPILTALTQQEATQKQHPTAPSPPPPISTVCRPPSA